MRRLCFVFLSLLLTIGAMAQKKDISQARDFVKKGTDLVKAEQLMTNLLKDSANRTNERIWGVLFQSLHKQYEQGNERLYLKLQYDTAALFVLCKRMFKTLEAIDSINSLPDVKRKIKPRYLDKGTNLLDGYRVNLFYGGIFFISKHKYADAYDFFDTYIDCARQPLFHRFNYNETDKRMPQAAYWAVYCGYKTQDPKATLKNTYLALKDTAHYNYMLQYLAETYKLEKDTARYVGALNDGFNKYPKFMFFFLRLIDYYSKAGDLDNAMRITNKALGVDKTNTVFRMAKGTLLLNTGKYAECITLSDSIIEGNDSLSGAYLNAGLAYYNMAVELNKSARVSPRNKKNITSYYQKSLPYLEKYRRLEPEEKEKWILPLYTIYLNLNMGKEFDEIDKMVRNEK